MKKQTIIAIGGGDFRTNKILAIDQEIVRSAGTPHPKFLFIPTASSDNPAHIQSITKHFTELGCLVTTLYLWKDRPCYEAIKLMILSADIIYVGGGNTLKMMNLWRKLGIDRLLAQARANGTVLCGVSAGSICWFKYGNSDSRKDKNPDADYIKVTGLGFINALHCPHYDSESARQESLKRMMRKVPGQVAIALDDCAALQMVDDTYRILATHDHANGYKVYWHKSKLYHEVIAKEQEFKLLEELLKK